MNTVSILDRRGSRQAGFSMVELLITSFILAVGLLGLTMLQIMSMRTSTGSRALGTAVMLGEGVLESIQSEGRQRMLFLKYSGTAPATTYFDSGNGVITQYYAFDGTLLPSATNKFYTVVITPSDVVTLGTAGGTKQFTIKVTFADTTKANGTPQTRTATLTRQVAYA